MIHKLEDLGQGVSYVISSKGVWLPGSYDSKKQLTMLLDLKRKHCINLNKV